MSGYGLWNDKFYGKRNIKNPVKCWNNHPVYYIAGMPIAGGSCTSIYPDVDLFIALDYGGTVGDRSYPWNEGVDIHFKIPDMGVPKNPDDFIKLLDYTAAAMQEGKSVFVGCIGGHGRTGLFLAALTTVITGNKNSIKLVRAEYCKKAVESKKQIDFLKKHFDIKPTKATKTTFPTHSLGNPKQDLSKGGTGDVLLGSLGVTEAPPTKYHCIKGKSVFCC